MRGLVIYFSSIILQASSVNITIGSHVWVEDPILAWIDGQVSRIDGQDVHVQTTNGKKVDAQAAALILIHTYMFCLGNTQMFLLL